MQDYLLAIVLMVLGSTIFAYLSSVIIARFDDLRIDSMKTALAHIHEGRPEQGRAMIVWQGRRKKEMLIYNIVIVFSLVLILLVFEFNVEGGLSEVALLVFIIIACLISGPLEVLIHRPGRNEDRKVILVRKEGIQYIVIDKNSSLNASPQLRWDQITGVNTQYSENSPIGLQIIGPGVSEWTYSDMENHGLFCRLLADELLALGKPKEEWVVKGHLPMGAWSTPVKILKDEN
jgi:hypothetical protein